MTITVENKAGGLVVPQSARKQAGFKAGDRLEVRAVRGAITIVNRTAASDEYTPAQRKSIDARLARAQKGPYHGPFAAAEDAIAFVESEIKSRRARRKGLSPNRK
ncbi:MAG: AbrB/MazE/SpoVT family DNA-binding domain-containing protein [Bryobacteraceae bacterium]